MSEVNEKLKKGFSTEERRKNVVFKLAQRILNRETRNETENRKRELGKWLASIFIRFYSSQKTTAEKFSPKSKEIKCETRQRRLQRFLPLSLIYIHITCLHTSWSSLMSPLDAFPTNGATKLIRWPTFWSSHWLVFWFSNRPSFLF